MRLQFSLGFWSRASDSGTKLVKVREVTLMNEEALNGTFSEFVSKTS